LGLAVVVFKGGTMKISLLFVRNSMSFGV